MTVLPPYEWGGVQKGTMNEKLEKAKQKAIEIYNIPIRWPFALVALIL